MTNAIAAASSSIANTIVAAFWWGDEEENTAWTPTAPRSWTVTGFNQELGDWSDNEEEETTATCWTRMRNAVLRRYRKLYSEYITKPRLDREFRLDEERRNCGHSP